MATQEEIFKAFADFIVTQTGLGYGSRTSGSESARDDSSASSRQTRADNIRMQTATKDFRTAVKAFDRIGQDFQGASNQIQRQVQMSSAFIDSAVRQLQSSPSSLAALDSLPKHFKGAIDAVGSDFVKSINAGMENLEDVFRVEDQMKILNELSGVLKEVNGKARITKEQYDRIHALSNEAGKAGMNLKDLGVNLRGIIKRYDDNGKLIYVQLRRTKDYTKTIKNVDRETKNLTKTIKHASESSHRFSGMLKGAKRMFAGLAAAATATARARVEEGRIAQDRAAGDAITFRGMTTAIKDLHISASQYAELLADNRRVMNATIQGGVNYNEQLITNTKALRYMSESSSAASKHAAKFADNMASVGVRQGKLGSAVTDQIGIYKKYFRAMSIAPGEFAAMTEAMTQDIGMRTTLARLRESERMSYIKGLQVRNAELQAIGFTTEEVMNMQKTVASLNQMAPKTRFQKAAQTQAMAGAMGMGGAGAELRQLMLKPVRGAEDQARVSELQMQLANRYQELRGASMQADYVFGTMADKFGMAEMLNKFESRTKVGREQDLEKSTATETDKMTSILIQGVDIGKATLSSSIGVAVGIGATTLAVTAGNAILTKILGATVSGNMVSGAAGAAGLGARGMMKAGGKSLLKKIPLIGAVAGIGFAASSAIQGDLAGAGLEVLSGLASIVPVLGTAASVGLDVYNMNRKQANLEESLKKKEGHDDKPTTEEEAVKRHEDSMERFDTLIIAVESQTTEVTTEQKKQLAEAKKSVEMTEEQLSEAKKKDGKPISRFKSYDNCNTGTMRR